MPVPAHSTPSSETRVKEFEKKFFTEYIREGRFKPYMGTTEGAAIQTKMRIAERLERIQLTLINKATGTGKRGTATLKGAEQQISDRTFEIQIDLVREGFASHKRDRKWTSYDMMKAQRHVAKEWISEVTKLEISEQHRGVAGKLYDNQVINDATNFPVASTAEKNAWHDNNADRILYGNAIGNRVASNHAASLANVAASQKVTAGVLGTLKRMAMRATPRIRPIRVVGTDQHWYLVWLDPFAMRDAREDATIQAFHKDALPRAKDNPFFTGGDLIFDGMILKENEDFPTLSGAGATSADLGTITLVGAQAIGMVWGQTTQFPEETDDYGVLKGVAAEEIRGIKKMLFGSGVNNLDNLKDHGIATAFVAASPDA